MTVKVVENSADQMVLKGRPTFVWGYGLFMFISALGALVFAVYESSVVCDRDLAEKQCRFIPRGEVFFPEDPIYFEVSEWESVEVSVRGGRQEVRLVLADGRRLWMGELSDDILSVDYPEKAQELKAFLEDQERQQVDVAVGNRQRGSAVFGGVALLAVIIMLMGPLRQIRLSRVDNRVTIKRFALWGCKHSEWTLDELVGAKMSYKFIRLPNHRINLKTDYGETIPLGYGGPLRKPRQRVCEEIDAYIKASHDEREKFSF
jgi:hypothetical protein